MGKMIKVLLDGKERSYSEGVSLEQIAVNVQAEYPHRILLALMDGKLRELSKTLTKDCTLTFLTATDKPGMQAYERSATLLLLKAIYHVAGHRNVERVMVNFSVNGGYYLEPRGDFLLNQDFIDKVRAYMRELVEEDWTINKRSIQTDDAIELFAKHHMKDKERLFSYRRVSKVNIYSIGDFEDYFYGYMVPSTGYLKWFDLCLYEEGLVLCLPSRKEPEKVQEFVPREKLFKTLKEAEEWSECLDILTVGALNDAIVNGRLSELILVQEALMEKKLADIAEEIKNRKGVKFVMIAGPSSSGKTTFSHRLSIQLKTHGMVPHPIAVDDYFVNRENTPKDENGEFDFECLESIDIEQFGKDMEALLTGEEVSMPTFNFKTGKREYKGNTLKLGPNDILVIEGIHCLNPAFGKSLPDNSKYKIYISALTQLNIDEHNRIPTTDGRLIRRMIRDARTRGASAEKTLHMWSSVRRGEEKNIFPYQEAADAMFNSALIYELAVLKPYAERLLFGIPKTSPEYLEAKRLLKFFDYFLSIGTEEIPQNSILREFVGGSVFNV